MFPYVTTLKWHIIKEIMDRAPLALIEERTSTNLFKEKHAHVSMNVTKIREDFPVLQKKAHGKLPIYFDNACMSLKPKQVIEKMNEYYNEYPACAERSHHKFGQKATEEYKQTKEILKKFINARSEHEIIYTKNTTESINLIAYSFDFGTNGIIITTDKEHNSNLIPWHVLRQRNSNVIHEVISTDNGFNMNQFTETLKKHKGKTILVSMVHVSNLDGTSIPLKDVIKIAHEYGATVMIDGAQSIPHQPIDVKKLDVDFFAYSGHKMLGPTGTGVLYGKTELLKKLKPFITGGSTVKDSTYTSVEFEERPEKFEAGLQNYAGFIGLGAATQYLAKHVDNIEEHEHTINKHATEALSEHIDILGDDDAKARGGILSFNAKNGMDYHEVALLLDSAANVMIRSGRHCVHSWFNAHKIQGSARASFYVYNTKEEVDIFTHQLKEILKMKR